jgi:hypothetical protein
MGSNIKMNVRSIKYEDVASNNHWHLIQHLWHYDTVLGVRNVY